jgi:hypothetical protein
MFIQKVCRFGRNFSFLGQHGFSFSRTPSLRSYGEHGFQKVSNAVVEDGSKNGIVGSDDQMGDD